MQRTVAIVSLMLLSGCGSCFDDKKVPEVDHAPTIQTVTRTTEGGGKRPVLVGESVGFAGLIPRDAGEAGAAKPEATP